MCCTLDLGRIGIKVAKSPDTPCSMADIHGPINLLLVSNTLYFETSAMLYTSDWFIDNTMDTSGPSA